MKSSWGLVGALIFFSIFYIGLLSTPKNLITADLGRHLKNGEIILSTFQVPNINLYSYTYPDYSFINHHWGTGVVFYLIYYVFSWGGLLWFFIIVSLVTFYIFFYISYGKSGWFMPTTISLLVMPLLGSRVEIRPELFSYFFIGIFYLILYKYQYEKLSWKYLLLLPILSLIWVNLHIYFVFGLVLIGIFFIENLVNLAVRVKDTRKSFFRVEILTMIGMLCLMVSFLNPDGLAGMFYPTQIFNNYGYDILENKSVFFVNQITSFPVTNYFVLILVIVILSWIVFFWRLFKKQEKYFCLSLFLITVIFGYLGVSAIRNISLFGLFSIVVISSNLSFLKNYFSKKDNLLQGYFYGSVLVVILGVLFYLSPSYWENRELFSFKYYGNQSGGVEFIKNNNLKGPIFNNYDIGGYLIFKLYPEEKVFVDNRPEAYPAIFFKEVYKPMQLDSSRFSVISSQYKFNVIYFYRLDLTEWAQKFLISRLHDKDWAPVYVDDQTIIFVKNSPQNKQIIEKYRLSEKLFNVKNSE